MKIIFLDFTGTIDIYRRPKVKWTNKITRWLKPAKRWGNYTYHEWNDTLPLVKPVIDGPDKRCVELLKKLVENTGALIVYSTTRRWSGVKGCIDFVGLDPMYSLGGEFGITPTPKFVWYEKDQPIQQIDVHSRQKEIKEWLDINASILDVDNYVILDDDIIADPILKEHWVSSIPGTGFLDKQYEEALRILEG